MKIVPPYSKHRLILGAIVSLSLTLGARAAEVVYSTDFESPLYSAGQAISTTSVNGWVGNHNGSSVLVQITDETSHGGKQCLMLMDQDTNDTPNAWHRFQGRTLENAEVAFYVKSVGVGSFRIDFADEEHGVNFMMGHGYMQDMGGPGFWVKPEKGNTISGVLDKTISYTPTEWNKVSFNYNKAEKTISVALNDKEVLQLSKAETEGLILQANRFRFATGWVAGAGADLKACIDDLVISTNP